MEDFNNDPLLSEDAFMEEGDFIGLSDDEFIAENEDDFLGGGQEIDEDEEPDMGMDEDEY